MLAIDTRTGVARIRVGQRGELEIRGMPGDFSTRGDFPDLETRRYRSIGIPVRAQRLTEERMVDSAFGSGGTFRGKAGDWLVTYDTRADGRGDQAIVDGAVFAATYEHLEDDRYRKRPVVIEAAQLMEALEIVTMEGPSRGAIGDWIVFGARGEAYFNSDTYFRENNELVDD
jgi:hypothetical protein